MTDGSWVIGGGGGGEEAWAPTVLGALFRGAAEKQTDNRPRQGRLPKLAPYLSAWQQHVGIAAHASVYSGGSVLFQGWNLAATSANADEAPG